MQLRMIPLAVLIVSFAFCVTASPADNSGAVMLKAQAAPQGASLEALLDPNHAAWQQAAEQAIHLNRTPPLYADGPFDFGYTPEASVRILHLPDQSAVVWMKWQDASENTTNKGQRIPDGGAAHIYQPQTMKSDRFSDAACTMVPQQRGPSRQYPNPMMGDVNAPVEMYLWKAGLGFSLLNAHGRASTANTGQPAQGDALRHANGWTIVQHVPNLLAGTPICFAIWDGEGMHRDGLKYYSLWYEISE